MQVFVLKHTSNIIKNMLNFHASHRSNFLKMKKSAMLIQKTWRGYYCRKNYGAVGLWMFLYKTPCDCCTHQQYLTLISRLADARWFLTTAGLVSLSQTLPDVPRGTTENHPFPGPQQRIPGAPGVQTPSLGRHHHPGVYERNDRPPTLQETQRRGENIWIYLQLQFITNYTGKKKVEQT